MPQRPPVYWRSALILLLGSACVPGAGRPSAAPVPWQLSTDRPSVSATPTLVPRGHSVVEAGLTIAADAGTRNTSIGEAAWRYGLGSPVELLVAVPSALVRGANGTRRQGIGDAGAGLRIGVREAGIGASPLAPALSVLATTSLPTGSDGFGSEALQPALLLLAGWSLPYEVGLTTNAGWAHVDGSGDELRASAALGLPIAARSSIFGEIAGVRPSGLGWLRPLLTLGGTHLATPRLQFDVFVRARARPGGIDHALGAGVARVF